jgi:uncharacterized coiled-coil protein SlyX
MKTVKQGENVDTMSSEERWARIDATLDRTAALAEKNEKVLNDLAAKLDRMAEDRILAAKEREIADKKRDESLTRLEKNIDKMYQSICGVKEELGTELDVSIAETSKGIEKLRKSVRSVTEELGGISKSNGMVAEDYFFASLNESKTFGGVHFDIVTQNMKNAIKRKDGSKLEGQYDIVLSNDDAACILEAKYRLREEDVLKLVDKQVDTFKILFPNYANYKIYLAVGGMTVEDEAMNTAKRLGIGVLTVSGDAVVVYDENLKVY